MDTATRASVAAAAIAATGVALQLVQLHRARPQISVRWDGVRFGDLQPSQGETVVARLRVANVSDTVVRRLTVTPLLNGRPAPHALSGPICFDGRAADDGVFAGLAPGATVHIEFPLCTPSIALLGIQQIRNGSRLAFRGAIDFRGARFGAQIRIGNSRPQRYERPSDTEAGAGDDGPAKSGP